MKYNKLFTQLMAGLIVATTSFNCVTYYQENIVQSKVIHVEAEDFVEQSKTKHRRWYRAKFPKKTLGLLDADKDHSAGASGTYLEVLPDTRQTTDDPLVHGESFSDVAGEVAVVTYEVKFPAPGRYYVWVRAYYTGTEDDGIHVGINNEWPESGQRMQWCGNPNTWEWQSKQRTEENHCGEPEMIYLDVPTRGRHRIHFSMRADGFEFDAFRLTKDYAQGPL